MRCKRAKGQRRGNQLIANIHVHWGSFWAGMDEAHAFASGWAFGISCRAEQQIGGLGRALQGTEGDQPIMRSGDKRYLLDFENSATCIAARWYDHDVHRGGWNIERAIG